MLCHISYQKYPIIVGYVSLGTSTKGMRLLSEVVVPNGAACRKAQRGPNIPVMPTAQPCPQVLCGDTPPQSTPRQALNSEQPYMASFSAPHMEVCGGSEELRAPEELFCQGAAVHGALPGLHETGSGFISSPRSSAADEQPKHQEQRCLAHC